MKGLTQLRDAVYTALERGDEDAALRGIAQLRRTEPLEAAGLTVALHIEYGRAADALHAWETYARLAPGDPYTIFLRARIHFLVHERAQALDVLHPLLGAKMPPAVAEKVWNLAGQCARTLGRAEDAVAYYERARDVAPDLALRALNASNALFNRHYLFQTPAEERRAAEDYGALFRGGSEYTHEEHQRTGGRRLRIGYLSPDVREHVVLSFSYALMTTLDPARFEVYVYALNHADALTEKVRQETDGFRNLAGCTAAEAAERIQRDDIDILVDLAGHTAGSTLPILAHRPAPIQVCGIGYFASTGLAAVDYFIADPILAAGHAADGFTEQLLILPQSHFCWCPLYAAPIPQHPPVAGRRVVFGSLNNFTKANDRVLSVWAEILRRVPESRLLLKTDAFSHTDTADEAVRRMDAAGIPRERVDTEGASRDYLAAYARMDIALDTFPYPGGGTTCDALYMGVPLVTLAGETLGSRFGASLLHHIGAGELIAYTEEEYIARAVLLAEDSGLLDALHGGLRTMLMQSSVMNPRSYGAALGAAYEKIWQGFAARVEEV